MGMGGAAAQQQQHGFDMGMGGAAAQQQQQGFDMGMGGAAAQQQQQGFDMGMGGVASQQQGMPQQPGHSAQQQPDDFGGFATAPAAAGAVDDVLEKGTAVLYEDK